MNTDWASLAARCSDGVRFIEEPHSYVRVPHGTPLVSVTAVCRAAIPDVRNVRRFWTERHRRVGQVAHACTALDDLGLLDPSSVAPDVEGKVEAWRKFRRDYAFTIGLVEQPVWSEGGTAGTTDRVVVWDGLLGVLDLKGFVDEPYVRLQTAGYATMFHERTGELPRVRIAVGLNNDGTYSGPHVWDSPRDWVNDRATWAAAVRMYTFWQQHDLLPREEG